MPASRRPWAALVGGCALACLAAAAQEKPQTPSFPATVDIVAVDVSVINSRGEPVTTLGPEDFTLTVGGKPRPIVSAHYVPLGGPTEATAHLASKPAEHYSTNEGVSHGRLIVIGIDQGSFALMGGGGRSAVGAVNRFLDRLSPEDRVALAAFPPPGPSVDFTADHEKIRSALAAVAGRAPPPNVHFTVQETLAYLNNDRSTWDLVIQRECGTGRNNAFRLCVANLEMQASQYGSTFRAATTASLRTLRALMDVMLKFEGPKTLVLIAGGLWSETAGEIGALATAASLARVTLFVFLVDGQSMNDASFAGRTREIQDTDPMFKETGLYSLAVQSRGAVFRASGTEDAAFDRMAREISGFYLLGFEPTPAERDGKVHEIGVRVARKDLSVRARRAVAIPARTTARTDEEVLATTLRSPLPETGIALRVTTYNLPDRNSPRVKLIVGAEIGHGDGPPGDLALAYVLVDEKGRSAAMESLRLPAAGQPGGRAAPYLGSAIVDPGRYTLKLSVLDRHGRQGSVERAVNAVRRSAAGLDLGDLMLADTASLGDGQYRPGVAVDVSDGALAGYLEMHASDPRRFEGLGVRLEVAREEDGPALSSAACELSEAGGGSSRIAQATLSIRSLPPGDYLARAVVTVGAARVDRISRPFHVSSGRLGEATAR